MPSPAFKRRLDIAKRLREKNAETRKKFDPMTLKDVTGIFAKFSRNLQNPADEVYANSSRRWIVQVWRNATPGVVGTPWEGTIRVAVQHSEASCVEEYQSRKNPGEVTWDDLQAIKDRFWPNQIAIEIYPPHGQIVDVADMRWLWVLPPGSALPFNLNAASEKVLQS